jgi:hypothetical protein
MINQICTTHEVEMEWLTGWGVYDEGGKWFCKACWIEEQNAVLFKDENMESIVMQIFDEGLEEEEGQE